MNAVIVTNVISILLLLTALILQAVDMMTLGWF